MSDCLHHTQKWIGANSQIRSQSMTKLIRVEQTFLIGHILSMAFGLAGLLLVLPNVDFINSLPEIGKTAFGWSMVGGGVVYMLLGTLAVAVYAYRTLGLWHWLGFMIPAIGLSLGSELLGTSTGFPFGHYHYLSGLGYKIAGLVPFTIPLSWFYLGFSAYIIVLTGLETLAIPQALKYIGAIGFGSLLLTSWDFVLDPAMSQTTMPFWVWEQPGAFFGRLVRYGSSIYDGSNLDLATETADTTPHSIGVTVGDLLR
jgi:uncharacterized membrane protein